MRVRFNLRLFILTGTEEMSQVTIRDMTGL